MFIEQARQLMIEFSIEDQRWSDVDITAIAYRAFEVATSEHGLTLDTVEISLLACNDARIAKLNQEFRGKAQPTNVLSWPKADLSPDAEGATPTKPTPDPDGTICLGDIAIAYDTCAREAAEQGKPLTDHVTHLLVHGLLHLLGYDHIRGGDAARMEALEVKILGKLGVPDPY